MRTRLARPLLGALVLALAACPRERASVEELYVTRTAGLGYLERNQLAEAESSFRKLTKLAPDDPLGWASLGLTYLQWGRFDDAEKQLKRARELDPRSADVGLALARLYTVTGRPDEARRTLEQMRRDSTGDAHVLYALARLDARSADPAARARYMDRLRDVLAVAPANLVARLELVDALVARGESDSAVKQLEEVRRIPPEPPREARAYLDSTIQRLRAADAAGARASLDRFLALMETTTPYQAALEAIRSPEGPIAGRPALTFVPKTFVSLHGPRETATVEVAKFVDATGDAGFPVAGATPGATTTGASAEGAIAAGDVDGDGSDEILVSTGSTTQLYRVQGGFVRAGGARSAVALPGGATFATFADVDNDGWLDLFALGSDGRGHLFRNDGTGALADVTAKAGIGDAKGARTALVVDADHDGDLDLLLVGGPLALYRNNLDGTFTDATAAYGLSGDAHDAAFADFDGDGRTDLLVVRARAGLTLYHNAGAQHFQDVTAASGIVGSLDDGAVAVGDYDNDGFPDIAVVGMGGGTPHLWHNRGDGTFAGDPRSERVLAAAQSIAARDVAFVDYDNDGWLDLVIGGSATRAGTPGLVVFRNDGTGRFLDRTSILDPAARAAGATTLLPADVDDDGDQDLLLIDGRGAVRFLRNDGGNSNLAVNVALKALRTGSGKNNTFGIGARLELRAGQIYQTRVVTSPVTHFGLGPHLKADVLRVEWPNGVPQTVYVPGSDQDVVEREMLKGSCAFAYTWDGTRFRFVTDAMWRSALGMPLGLMGSASAFAPAGASQEYVRIPGDALAPKDGRYLLQLTEELWETAYADQVVLVAVDHPDSVDVFVDETFVPPGPLSLRLYQVGRRSLPRSAVDERGADVLPALSAADDVYVSNLVPTKYQGVVAPHDLVLDLGPDAGGPGSHLFLRGWIYPTDASINVALGQQTALAAKPPSLEVRDATGRWKTVIPSLGFPSGKDKTMIVDLAGKFPTADHHVRIRTSMQIYWDHAFVARDLGEGGMKIEKLAPRAAELHERGFSRMYRKGGRYGPYWFDYASVTKENPWRPITGSFTRFGDVLPLLQGSDDRYVIMAPGDEATIAFDASSARSIPPGWKRDFLLYTDGWIKDSDLNTAFGTTVEPLPFHAATSYPFQPGEHYPTDAEHERYRREYLTRRVPGAEARAPTAAASQR